MRFKNRSASLVAAAMGALLLAPIQPPSALATSAVATNNTLSITSGSLIVFATGSQSFTNTGTIFSTTLSNGTVRTFHINNSGTLSATRFLMTITLPSANSNVSAFRRCAVNISFTGTNTCASGSPVTITHPIHNAATTYTLALPANGFYSFQIVQNKSGTMLVSVSASLADVSGATSHS